MLSSYIRTCHNLNSRDNNSVTPPSPISSTLPPRSVVGTCAWNERRNGSTHLLVNFRQSDKISSAGAEDLWFEL